MIKTAILGAGTYGEVFAEYLHDTRKFDIIGFLDDDKSKIGKMCHNLMVFGPIAELPALKEKGVEAIFAPIGDNVLRMKFLKEAVSLGFSTPGFLHDSVQIHHTVSIGNAVYILPGTSIMPFTSLSDYTMISMNVNIAHHTTIGQGCFISMGANIGASLSIGEAGFVGISATIMTGVKSVGSQVIVGAGSLVTKDVPENSIVAGVPARVIRKRN